MRKNATFTLTDEVLTLLEELAKETKLKKSTIVEEAIKEVYNGKFRSGI